MKIYFIAGEISGDYIGGSIIKALKEVTNNSSQILGIGGKAMGGRGLQSLFPIKQINLMGFFEILPHIFRLRKLIENTVDDIISHEPDILVTIDSPGFTYRVAKKVRLLAPNIRLVHIVAPSVWAYKPGRAIKYANLYDRLLTLFPFEPKYFTEHGLDTSCIGHPILEQKFYDKSPELKEYFAIDPDVKAIAVTCGSRVGEINRHMPIIRPVLEELARLYNIKVIFIQPNESNAEIISRHLLGAKFNYIFTTERLKAFAACDYALAKSGTNILEIAASGTPMIIGYKLNALSFLFIKMLIRIKYACLINIIENKEIIPEFIQADFTPEKLVKALNELITDKDKASKQISKSRKILEYIGLNNNLAPSTLAAKKIIEML